MTTANVHYVTVTPGAMDEDGWREQASVKFECRGNRDSKCHQYPDCDCEGWDEDHDKNHPFEQHDECWMQGWFDNDGHSYTGDEANDMDECCIPSDMDGQGPITATYMDGYVEWEFETTSPVVDL